MHARDLTAGRRTDGSHLLVAPRDRRIRIAYNRRHYLLLHDAWKRWAHNWGVSQQHGGILCLAQTAPRDLYLAIDVFLQSNLTVANELDTYDPAISWVQEPYVP